jgi:hypothetical protein
MQEVSQVSGGLNARSVGRWVVALAATAALVAGGGILGSVGATYAGGAHDDNVGSPGRNGQDATCTVYRTPLEPSPDCTAVGEDGGDGAPGAVYR